MDVNHVSLFYSESSDARRRRFLSKSARFASALGFESRLVPTASGCACLNGNEEIEGRGEALANHRFIAHSATLSTSAEDYRSAMNVIISTISHGVAQQKSVDSPSKSNH
jgi:hypothetical protein